jgi:anti-sigma regulatory factor (Ser/Thr protein kinase)
MKVSETRFAADAGAAAAARQFVSEAGIVPAGLLPDVVLLVSELTTNAVKHGPDRSATIGISVSRSDGGIRVAVENTGSGFTAPVAGSARVGSGMGLRLVEQLSSRWGIEADGHTIVWFEIDPDAQ